MCFTCFLEVDGECKAVLGVFDCHLWGCELGPQFFKEMAEDIDNTDVRVVLEIIDPYLERAIKFKRCPSSVLQQKGLKRLVLQLETFVENCETFTCGTVRVDSGLMSLSNV